MTSDSHTDGCDVDTKVRSMCTVGHCRQRRDALRTQAAGHSEIGTVRSSNDDLVFASQDCRLYIVLDGVGGYAGGSEASRILLEKLRASIERLCEKSLVEANRGLESGVRKALAEATAAMLRRAESIPNYAKMSTVFALGYVVNGVLLYTHVGDCRLYLVRDGVARQLTVDETFVQLMVDEGSLLPEDAARHPLRNLLLNSVGTNPAQPAPCINSVMLRPSDTLVFTTDGVSDYLDAKEISDLASQSTAPNERAKAIVHAALDAKSRDNVSCVVVDIERARHEVTAETELQFELAKLHDMLSSMGDITPDMHADLIRVSDDIRRAIHQDEPQSEIADLRKQLKDHVIDFESKHPQLSSIINGIVDMLSGIGI